MDLSNTPFAQEWLSLGEWLPPADPRVVYEWELVNDWPVPTYWLHIRDEDLRVYPYLYPLWRLYLLPGYIARTLDGEVDDVRYRLIEDLTPPDSGDMRFWFWNLLTQIGRPRLALIAEALGKIDPGDEGSSASRQLYNRRVRDWEALSKDEE